MEFWQAKPKNKDQDYNIPDRPRENSCRLVLHQITNIFPVFSTTTAHSHSEIGRRTVNRTPDKMLKSYLPNTVHHEKQ